MRASITRRGYGVVPLYEPDRSPCRIDLSDNTNAWGMPPAAREAIASVSSAVRYPSPYAEDLKCALARYIRLPERMITTGCGSDDVLDSAIRALAEPGDRLAYAEPTFPMIPIFARLNGLVPIAVPLEELAATGARILYVCSPNNPTGTLTSRSTIGRLLEACSPDQVVIVDEAYAEFAGSSIIDLARESGRLLVTRTMSKAFGLAGLRVGYAAGNASLVAEVEKSRGPYKVSGVAERAAIAALTEGREWVDRHIALAIQMRAQLIAALRERGLGPIESAANFVFVPLANAVAVSRTMRSAGIALRAFDAPAGLRITVAPWPMMGEVLSALDEARAACA